VIYTKITKYFAAKTKIGEREREGERERKQKEKIPTVIRDPINLPLKKSAILTGAQNKHNISLILATFILDSINSF
jgi:hypothetical protein